MSGKSYDSRLKFDAIYGSIPAELKKVIKPHQIYRWRREDLTNIVGFDYYNEKETDLKALSIEARELRSALKKVQAENQLLSVLRDAVTNHYSTWELTSSIKEKVVDNIDQVCKIIGVKKCTKIFNITHGTLRNWRQLMKMKCDHSMELICVKNHPNKLLKEEEMKIVELLKDSRFSHFPMMSLVWKARYEDIVHASYSTWKKIKKQHNIVRASVKKKDVKKGGRLTGTYANQYLHADITHFKLKNHKKYYIYIVKDNYTKYIKSWAISSSINTTVRIKTFRGALKDLDPKQKREVTFVTDQGPENNNKRVKAFFKKKKYVDIKYALKDIPYSNAMIERFNKDLKYMYLYRENINSLKQLHFHVDYAIHEHNFIRRMGMLHGQTPFEFYKDVPAKTEMLKAKMRETIRKRKHKVKKMPCCLHT